MFGIQLRNDISCYAEVPDAEVPDFESLKNNFTYNIHPDMYRSWYVRKLAKNELRLTSS